MTTRLAWLWDTVRGGFWFLPAGMAFVAVSLAVATLRIDEFLARQGVVLAGWLWHGEVDGARQVLSALVGSLATVAAVVFSITVMTLSIASSQFGPLLLRNFTRDPGNQLVLGAFVAAFVYCLSVLGVVRGGDDPFLPQLSISIGILFAILSLAILIYFVHHIARSINGEQLVANVANELNRGIARVFPEELGHEPEDDTEPPPRLSAIMATIDQPVPAPATGYLQAIDNERLMETAVRHDLVLRLLNRPGDYVAKGGQLMQLSRKPGDRAITQHLQATCLIGPRRTPNQDVEYLAQAIVQIAVRALSPGTNDPFTAVVCVDWLSGTLSLLARRKMPSPYRMDQQGNLRVIAPATHFADFADIAFNQIRQYGKDSVAVSLRLLEAIVNVAEHVRRPADRQALREHAERIDEDTQQTLANARDRNKLRAAYQSAIAALEGERPPAATRAGSGSEESEKS